MAKDDTEAKTKGLVFKDWATLIFSGVAITLSVATAFWDIARVEENLSVVVSGPQLAFRIKNDLVAGGEESDLLFINSGNRPVGILAVEIYFLTDDGPKKCEGSPAVQRFTTAFRPIVVKENEIKPVKIKIDGIYSLNQPGQKYKAPLGQLLMNLEDKVSKKNEIEVVSCLFVQLSTHSVAIHPASAFISKFKVIDDKNGKTMQLFNPTDAEISAGPQELYSHFGTIFERPVTLKTLQEANIKK